MEKINFIKYVGFIFGVYLMLASCEDNESAKAKLVNVELSNLKVYQNPDRVAPKCSDVDALETNGKYSEELKDYTGKIKVCNNQGTIVTLYSLKNGKHNGYFYTYDDTGLLIGKTYYHNDQKNGDFIQLDKAGRILIKAKYVKDELVKCDGPFCEQLKNIN